MKKFTKSLLLAVPVALTPLAANLAVESLGFPALTSATLQAQEEKKKTQYKTKKSYSLRQPVFKDFAKVQEKTEAEDWNGALVVLKELESKKAPKYTSFEKANLWNYFGWIYYSLENFDQAIRYYQKVLAEEQLSDALKLGTLYTLAQLQFVQEDYRAAIDLLKQWMAIQPIVGADAYVLLAQGYYQLGDMKQAMVNVDIAVERFESKGKVPKENWYALQRAVYYDKGDNKKVIEILQKLVKHYPKATYWKQLSGMYGMVGRDKDQLHSLETAYLMGAVTKEKELMNLAYLFMGEDAPYKAAKVIDKGIKAKQIEETSKNLEILATAWRMAQEVKKSIPEMEKAASKSDKGDLYASLANIYQLDENYAKAIAAGQKALERGGVKRLSQLHSVLGVALINQKKYRKAIEQFKLAEKAAKTKLDKQYAGQMLEYAKSEMKREESLKI
ncbi:tetratricopeptide repeat protein [Candidatus Pelagadaptatus aseana]|uniref:tetratricopeptide repeat protein n=1 Tax=Candidatus Pelagadaptatus aseana TaxID=3120508 RepID=UPI003C6F6A1D